MSPDPLDPSRRYFLGQCTGLSLGAMALSTLVGRALAADGAGKPGLPHLPHFAAKAKRVIFLTQSGGPSQIELFDEKPGLTALAGTELPESVRRGQRLHGVEHLLRPPLQSQRLRVGRVRAPVPSSLVRQVCADICSCYASRVVARGRRRRLLVCAQHELHARLNPGEMPVAHRKNRDVSHDATQHGKYR